MRIFSFTPANSNFQTSQNKNLSNSQKFQSAPKINALSHDQVSFTSEIQLKDTNGILRAIVKNVDDLLPNFWKSAQKDQFCQDLIDLATEKQLVIRVFANKLSKGAQPCTGATHNTSVWIQIKKEGDDITRWGHDVPRAMAVCADELYPATKKAIPNVCLDYNISEGDPKAKNKGLKHILKTAVKNFVNNPHKRILYVPSFDDL